MKQAPLLLAAACAAILTLSACQSAYSGNPEKYKRDHDRYMRTHEPKTGGPDL